MAGEYYPSIDEKQAFSCKRGVTVQTVLTSGMYSPAEYGEPATHMLNKTANKFYRLPPLRALLKETSNLL
jgi:hypothetical protein